MRVDQFDFELPEDRIALQPLERRDGARLLHVRGDGRFIDRRVGELAHLFEAGDVVVVNDTRVIPAQLAGERRGRDGAPPVKVDVTLHKQIADGRWRAFARPAKRLKENDEIAFSRDFTAVVEARRDAEVTLSFNRKSEAFDAALRAVGAPPLPPYIARKRPANEDDAARYQTVFAARDGSVAAPTAGLHFTEALLAALSEKGVHIARVTLHVGAGTFLPVSVEDTRDHKMHAEWGEVSASAAAIVNRAREAGGRIVAVGTTSLRLLESAATQSGEIRPFADETDIFITPGYRFRAVDRLLTNFHLPRSTLFMLVCAFSGVDVMRSAYEHAVGANYRFYSYGDACLLERPGASS